MQTYGDIVQKAKETLLSEMLIEDTELPVRVKNVCAKSGINTVKELLDIWFNSHVELFHKKNFGIKSSYHVKYFIENLGLCWKCGSTLHKCDTKFKE